MCATRVDRKQRDRGLFKVAQDLLGLLMRKHAQAANNRRTSQTAAKTLAKAFLFPVKKGRRPTDPKSHQQRHLAG